MRGDHGARGSSIPRRGFLTGALVLGAAACTDGGDPAGGSSTPTSPGSSSPADAGGAGVPVPELPGDPFTLGVSSGDPLPESVLLWTRLKPVEGPVPDQQVPVSWQVSVDEDFVSDRETGAVVG